MIESTILVVDSEPSITRLCKRILERHGFAVQTVNSPPESLAILERDPISLLLIDIRLPEIDGFQLIDLARKRQPELAVVVMTGLGTLEAAIEVLRYGADGVVLKPFTTAELLESVHYALETSQHKQDVLRLQALRPLFDITERLFSETDPTRLKELILDAVVGYLHCSLAEYYHKSETLQRASASAIQNLAISKGKSTRRQPILAPIFQQMGNSNRESQFTLPLLISPESCPNPEIVSRLDTLNLGAVLCAPASLEGWVGMGTQVLTEPVILAARQHGEPAFRQSEMDMFMILARQGAVALENARLHAELRDYLKQVQESQRALIQSEKMAGAGRLIASIAHEINNPLQAMQNCLHLARRMELPVQERERYMGLAQDELERLMNTVQRMLDYYRPAGLDLKPTDVNNLLLKVLSLAHKQLEDQGVMVTLKLAEELPPTLAVSDQLQQVFLNMILNASEAMNKGGSLEIETRYQARKKSGDQILEILFQDSGPGIPKDHRKHIFEPFVSTKRGGIGLGLAVSYGIISAHGGSLELVDNSKPGACFRILLKGGGS